MTPARFIPYTIATAMALASPPALAALASPYQRAAEFAAVIEAAVPVLAPIAIESVEFVQVDKYEVRTSRCVLIIDIVDVEREGPPIAGPRQFEAVAGEPMCEAGE